ncbi:MAG: D-alanyl-D-alanine carboxypeptidase [bacterium]|nr:D-alanyl-D-alanine carboxypeptidase [bacterium]
MRSRSLCPAVVLLLTATLQLGLFDPSSAAERRKFIKPPTYQTAVLLEPETGQYLIEDEPHKLWPPASLTKMMSMLIVMEKLKEGTIKLTDPIQASAKASRMGGSQIYLKHREVFSVEDLMRAVVIASANDATMALAEHIGGSEAGFIELMNIRAEELGMHDSRFYSVHGLPPDPGEREDVTTAHDMALLARELVKYPNILEWGSVRRATIRNGKFVLRNLNTLVKTFRGADGLKTGHYAKAGFNMVATAKRRGTRFVAVVLGAPTDRERFSEAARLLALGFNLYRRVEAIKAGELAGKKVTVYSSLASEVEPVAAHDVVLLLSRAEVKKLVKTVNVSEAVTAPVEKGQRMGEIIWTVDGAVKASTPLVAAKRVEYASWFRRLLPY